MLYHNYEKVFQFRKFFFFIRIGIRNFFLLCLCLKNYLSINKKKMQKELYEFFLFSGFASSLLIYKTFFKLREQKNFEDKFFEGTIF